MSEGQEKKATVTAGCGVPTTSRQRCVGNIKIERGRRGKLHKSVGRVVEGIDKNTLSC